MVGASKNLVPDLQHPENPVPLVADPTRVKMKAAGDQWLQGTKRIE
ncbi:MAG TPA: hypothetical protein VFA98_06755 [Thermoanaerobaculia bacterium]|nr:hypothetical protein [Thermoanaerobaculia bacterium]